MRKYLNLDIAGSVSEFELLIRKVLPKNILFQIVYGKGVEFDGYRDFAPDEDSSNIDWKATVRSNRVLARKYIEERDLKFVFLIDVSDNMVFGSTKKLKCEYVAELVSALAHVILVSGDRVGFILFNNNIVRDIPLKFGERQFNTLTYELSNPLNYGGVCDFNSVLDKLLVRLDPSTSVIFLVSDFLSLEERNKKMFQSLAALFETIAIVVKDPLDVTLPLINKELVVEDPETMKKMIINPKIAKTSYEANASEQTRFMRSIFNDSQIDFVEFSTDEHFALNLAEFLKERSKRRFYKKKNVH
jgi:uncharacterized protein (DUF58 family)